MDKKILSHHLHSLKLLAVSLLAPTILLLALAVLGYFSYSQSKTIKNYKGEVSGLKSTIDTKEKEILTLEEALYSEQNKNALFEQQIKEIAGTVGLLDKLSKTDPELLQKYSRVYFLNEHYIPDKLTKISEEYVYPANKELYVHANVSRFLSKMIEKAGDNDIDLKIISAYRSFDTQASLKSGYKVVYGSGANQFSADQGYSEHQLGTTVDITTAKTGNSFESFDGTESYRWLTQNAYKYGFILSYPKGNSYYQYEPWHWRFVGVELATRLHEDEMAFYDLDQRTIDGYLVNIFD